ncbi:polyprenyl diphosphate synthase [Nonomuraea sp. NPDC049129]|uniref:polyprenyl diphosphate synthase n=1 Tax=Nonomuraea sp. NPDC049129 TaxID=3155272 RepID=UPI0033E9564E
MLRLIVPSRPQHVALIMDGNRRWARRRGLTPSQGHDAGFAKVVEVADWAERLGIQEITLWMLSTENMQREAEELNALMPIICRAVKSLVDSGRFTVRHIGNPAILPAAVVEMLSSLPYRVNGALSVNVAIGYGGPDEIVRAACRYLAEGQKLGWTVDDAVAGISEDALEAVMGNHPSPPDLIIRTSGERRLSGFLLWSSAEAALHIARRHWPDFRQRDLIRGLLSYGRRRASRRSRPGTVVGALVDPNA